jgi:hypothetical protein
VRAESKNWRKTTFFEPNLSERKPLRATEEPNRASTCSSITTMPSAEEASQHRSEGW